MIEISDDSDSTAEDAYFEEDLKLVQKFSLTHSDVFSYQGCVNGFAESIVGQGWRVIRCEDCNFVFECLSADRYHSREDTSKKCRDCKEMLGTHTDVWNCRICNKGLCMSCSETRLIEDTSVFVKPMGLDNVIAQHSVPSTEKHVIHHDECRLDPHEMTAEQQEHALYLHPLPMFYSFWDLLFREIAYKQTQSAYWQRRDFIPAFPRFGDVNTPFEQVNAFYEFWDSFKTRIQDIGGGPNDLGTHVVPRLEHLDPRMRISKVQDIQQRLKDVLAEMQAMGSYLCLSMDSCPISSLSSCTSSTSSLTHTYIYIFICYFTGLPTEPEWVELKVKVANRNFKFRTTSALMSRPSWSNFRYYDSSRDPSRTALFLSLSLSLSCLSALSDSVFS